MSSPTPSTTAMNASTSTSASASVSTPQTTPGSSTTTANTNGESSQPKPTTTSAKPAKPKPKSGGDGAPKEKEKSAKELAKEAKKEKRAALVAARGGGEEGEGPGPGPGPRNNHHGDREKVDRGHRVAVDGTPHPHTVNSPTTSTHPHPHSAQRPTFNSTDSAIPYPKQIQQELFYSHVISHKSPDTREAFNSGKIHPLIVRLGVLMANGELRGANARTMGMMNAFQEVIRDYQTPEDAVMWKDLMVHLSPMITYLEGCRPKGTGGGNAIRWLKSEINRIGEEGGRTEEEQKEHLIKAIDSYLEVRIHLADQVIAETAREKIKPGCSVVAFARSSVVEQVLTEAWDDMRDIDPEASFSVVVVDSRPLNEGLGLLESLTHHGIPCTYVLLTQASHLISRSSLVLLGGSALHSDGALYARSGTAVVAMMAKEYRIPVVVCVETYKFGERVVLDGIANNELSVAEDVFKLQQVGCEIKEELRERITSLPLLYDLTPPQCITAVCTEIGFIPPSSVPTVLGKGHGQ